MHYRFVVAVTEQGIFREQGRSICSHLIVLDGKSLIALLNEKIMSHFYWLAKLKAMVIMPNEGN